MPVYKEPQFVTGTLSIPLRLVPPKTQREILDAANHGQNPCLTFTIKQSFVVDGFSVVNAHGQEALLVFDIYANDITFE